MKNTMVFLGLILLSAVVAFAGGEKEPEPAATGLVALDVFAGKRPNVECMDSPCNKFTEFIEQKFNIKIEWVTAPENARREKQQLLLASGDYPAVFLHGEFNNADQTRYGSEGVLQPLNDLIEDHGPNIRAAFELKPYFRPELTALDGNIYSLPAFEECYHCTVNQKHWINTEWLDTLGLPMPKTLDDYEQVLTAFKNQDPNGNGKQDEIPLTGSADRSMRLVYNYLMNGFIYNDGIRFLYMDSGTVKFAANTPEWRDGLRYVARLYSKGLIDPQAFTQNRESGRGLVNREPVIVGAFAAFTNRGFARKEDNWQKYRAIPPLKGPEGVQLTAHFPSGVRKEPNFAITDKATEAQKMKAFELADWGFTQEGTLYLTWGLQEDREGRTAWRYARPGELGMNGEQAIYHTETWIWEDESRNAIWGGMGPKFNHLAHFSGWESSQDILTIAGFERFLVVESDKYIPFVPDEIVPERLYFRAEDNQRVAQYRTEIRAHVNQNAAAFVTGQKSLDSDWDAYVAGFKGFSLDEYLRLTQDAVDHGRKAAGR